MYPSVLYRAILDTGVCYYPNSTLCTAVHYSVIWVQNLPRSLLCKAFNTNHSPHFNYFLGWNHFRTNYTMIRCIFWRNTLFSGTPCSCYCYFGEKLNLPCPPLTILRFTTLHHVTVPEAVMLNFNSSWLKDSWLVTLGACYHSSQKVICWCLRVFWKFASYLHGVSTRRCYCIWK